MATAQLRLPAADRKEQIIAVATELFAKQGFQGTTTRQISERAGVTEALIFRHFASKEELYWAVIERKTSITGPAERMRESLQKPGSDLEILASVAEEILERRAADQTLSRLLLYSALENHRLSQRFFRIYAAECYDVLADYIRQRIDAGAFRPVDPVLAARGFMGMIIYHSWVQELFGGKHYQDFSVKQVSSTLCEVWLRGMVRNPQSAGKNRRSKSRNRRTQPNGILKSTS